MLRRLAISAGALTIAVTSLTACGGDKKESASPTPATTASVAAPTPTPSGVAHKITVVYDEPANQAQADAKEILSLGGTDGVADGFSQNFDFPVDLTIHARSGEGSPNYDPSTKTVNLYYDFVDLTGKILKAGEPSITDNEYGKQWAATDGFVLIHELGHAFVDVFDIPITGREEDAVDGLATVFLTAGVENGAEYTFDAARFFSFLQDYQGSPDAEQFADEHSLSIQRANDIVCKVAGSSDASLEQVHQLNILPESRLARCPAEFRQVSKAWTTLLKPHLRDPS